MAKTRISTIKIFLLFVLACCIICFSACSSSDKYGNEETYYDLNSGNTVYFDGNGNCNFCGADCTYKIKNDTYYIYGDNTLSFKKMKDGVLVDTFKESSSFLNVSVRSGYISGSIMIDNSITYLYDDGSYRIGVNNSIGAIGNYYYNDGVLVLEQTGGLTNTGIWVDGTVYSVVYVNEETGKLSGVLLANPSYYKQWHFNGSNGNNNGDDDNNNNNNDNNTVNPYLRHTLTYDLNYDGLSITAQPIAKGENINLIVPERVGYEFLGWHYNYSKVESGIWQFDSDITLTARWEAIDYFITYNTDGGTMPEYYLKSFNILSNLPYTLPVPTKQGLNFAGWYETEDFSDEQITAIPKNSLQNYVLYARYTDEQLLEYELSFDETYYSVIGYKGNPQYITVPETYNGLPVKEIAATVFGGCTTLVSVILPNSICKIGGSAFYGCNSLESITYAGDIKSWCEIQGLANLMYFGKSSKELYFNNIKVEGDLEIPYGVTYIDNGTFYNCSSLTSVTIPDGVTSIGYQAFYNCSSLTSVTIPDSVTYIDSSAFYNCSSLTSVTIPNSVTYIGNYAFHNCSSLTSIIIPDGVTSIGDYAFSDKFYKRYSGCYYLSTKSSEFGFLYQATATDISGVKIHSDCKTINSNAFYNCSSLTSVTIPDGVTSIGYHAFYNCSSLTSVTIPDSVTNIGDAAFYYNYGGATNVFYIGNADDWSNIKIGRSCFTFSITNHLYYFTETEPTDDGNYWHYDTDGKTPIIWQKEN